MSTAYLDVGSADDPPEAVSFRSLTLMPDTHVDELEENYPGWLLGQLTSRSRWLDSRLRKRYAAPFAAPYPETVIGWLCDIVTLRAMLKRGVDPTDAQFSEIKARHDAAETQVTEAADSEKGLFDLPLATGGGPLTSTGISQGGPLVYSEQSPYAWRDVQACQGRLDDQNGRGATRG